MTLIHWLQVELVPFCTIKYRQKKRQEETKKENKNTIYFSLTHCCSTPSKYRNKQGNERRKVCVKFCLLFQRRIHLQFGSLAMPYLY